MPVRTVEVRRSVLLNQGDDSSILHEIAQKKPDYLDMINKIVKEDVFHKISRKIVDLLIDSKITKLVVGYNKGWKTGVNMGKKNNQKFTQIPFARLVSYLEYKCELAGIEIVIHEESYTSKCDSLAFEKIGKHENYLGKRKNRGLFQSSVGKLINADVNGALNIMRKVVGDSCESIRRIIDRGLLFNPVRITNVFC